MMSSDVDRSTPSSSSGQEEEEEKDRGSEEDEESTVDIVSSTINKHFIDHQLSLSSSPPSLHHPHHSVDIIPSDAQVLPPAASAAMGEVRFASPPLDGVAKWSRFRQ
jgi:hypothetical protein